MAPALLGLECQKAQGGDSPCSDGAVLEADPGWPEGRRSTAVWGRSSALRDPDAHLVSTVTALEV